MGKARTVVDTSGSGYPPRELILGVEHNGAARAYVIERLLRQKLVQDWVGGSQVIVVVVGPDNKSTSVFEASQGDFYREPDDRLIDSTEGPSKG